MFLETAGEFVFGDGYGGMTTTQWKKSRRVSVADDISSHMSRRREAMLRMTNAARLDNEKHRRPCPTCSTLVKPSLQKQHNAAYHPKKAAAFN